LFPPDYFPWCKPTASPPPATGIKRRIARWGAIPQEHRSDKLRPKRNTTCDEARGKDEGKHSTQIDPFPVSTRNDYTECCGLKITGNLPPVQNSLTLEVNSRM